MEKLLLNPSVRTIAFLLFLLLPLISYSQTPIWEEDFSTYSDGATTGTGSRWTTTTSGTPDWFEVRSNLFEGKELDGLHTFTTENIDISGYTNVSLSVDISELGSMEADDYLRIYYQIDTGSGFGTEIYFATNGNNFDEFGSIVASQTGLNGQSIRIVIRTNNNSNTEYHRFDNILVEGTLACTPVIVAPTDVSASPSTIFDGSSADLNATSAGNTINWYTVSSGGTSIGSSASGANFSVSPTSTTTYYAEADDGSCPSATRTSVTVTVISYCTPTYANGPGSVDEITNVTLGTLNNNSGASSSPYYTFFNAVTIPDLTPSTTASVSITFGSDPNQYSAVWIDFNQDGTFDTSEGFLAPNNAGSNGTITINIPVPATAVLGNTRMRIRGGDDSALTTSQACNASNSSYGETEDYIVNILTACTPPSAPTVSSDVSICNGNSTNLVGTSAGNTINWFTVSSGGSSIGSSASGANYSVSPSSTTTYYAEADDGSGCVSATRTPIIVTVNDVPAQPSIITGSAMQCLGATSQTYSVVDVLGTTYTWILPSGWSQTAGGTTNSITVTVGSGSGNIQVTPSNSCGNGTAQTLAVTSSDVPAQPSSITGNVNVCEGGSETYSVTNVLGVTYNWIFPAGWVQTAGGITNSITVTVGSGSGNIQVTPSNSCGDGTVSLLAVSSSPGPSQPSVITGSASVCVGSSETYSVTNVLGVSYSWILPAGWSQTAGGTTNSISVTVGSGSGNIQVTPSNGTCNGMSRTFAVSSSDVPAQPSVITGSPNVCDGTTETYSVTNVVGVSYNWTVPAGWSIDSGNGSNSITVSVVGLTTGNIEVTPSNSCGNGPLRSLAVSSSAISQPSVITGNTDVCEGATETYSITNVSGLSYSWTLPTGWTIDSGSGTNSITVTVGTGSGNIEVTPSNACGNGPVRLLAVTSNLLTTIDTTTPGSRNGPGTVNLSATATFGGTVSWYADPVGGTALGTGDNFTTPGIITTTTFYVDASNGPCFSTPRVPVVATVHYSEITVFGDGNIILDEDNTPITTDYTNLGDTPILVGLTRTYTIENTGTIDLTIGAFSISGVDASDFVVTLLPASTVTPTESTTFEITFTPTALGVKDANISFITNDPDENPFNFDIRGTGSTGLYPEINIRGNGNTILDGASAGNTGDHTDFGSVSLPGSITRTFTIENTGTGPLLLTGVPIVIITGGSDFTVTAQPTGSSIAAGGNLTFEITYNPIVTGSSIAIVSINNNDVDENIYDFVIEGAAVVSGVEIDIQGNDTSIVDGDITPSVLDQTDFGITDATTSINLPFQVYSFGSSQLNVSGISITGADAAQFSFTPISDASLDPGETGSFVITFTPTASLGIKNATISVASNDLDEDPYTFSVRAEVQSIPLQTVAPGGITSNLKFWLKADSNIGVIGDNTNILTWEDQTFGSTKNAVSKLLKEPKFQNNTSYNVNFNPVVHFDGNDYMSGGQGFNNEDMFIVIKPTSQVSYTTSPYDIYCGDDIDMNIGNGGGQDVTGFEMGNTSARHSNEIIAYNQAGNGNYGVAEISTTKLYVVANIFNPRKHASFPSPRMEILNNGNTLTTTEQNTDAADYHDIVNSRYWLGRSEPFDASYDGDILEIINYDVRNNDTDKRKIETYLAIKYGITLGTSPLSLDYVDSGGTVIYDAGASYNYNIAGIGRDDDSELNQKQSKTENTINDITIGLGDIYDVNSNNPNNFSNDRDYLVWGHNNNTLSAQTPIVVNISNGPEITPSLTTNVDFISIGRTWRVKEKGNIPSCKVSIPESMLTATITPPGNFLMFISDNPVFNPTAEYRILTLNGSNLETDYDFLSNGTKYITFGYAPERSFTRSIQFDGVQDYLDAGDVLDLNAAEFTVSAWVKRDNQNASIFSKRDNGYSSGYDFKINASGEAELSWNGGSEIITSSVGIPINEWHQVAVIFDGSVAKLYIDGVEDTAASTTAPFSQPIGNNESFIIAAAASSGTTSFFEGNIDEIRVWNKALSEEELRFVMNQEILDNTNVAGSYFYSNGITPTKDDITSGTLDWSNLRGYYPMSTYTYTNLKDESGNGNTAALKNLNTVDHQTAPLPYVSQANSSWDTSTTWNSNSYQTIPGTTSIIDNTKTVDWNIVQIASNVTMNNAALPGANYGNRNVLGLIVDNTFELTSEGTTTLSTDSNSAGTGNGLTVSHYLGLDGKIDLEGESQLIQTTDSDLVVGLNGEIERDQQGNSNIFRYNDWSSPVYSKIVLGEKMFTIADVLRDGSTPSNPQSINFVGGYNGAVGPPISIADYWLFVRNGDPFTADINAAWDYIGNSGNIQIGAGFLMKGTGSAMDQNYVFQGNPNNGDITVTVKDNNDYLVGNPYPSAIDADLFIADNATSLGNNGTIYFWDHFGGNSHILNEYEAGHATYNYMGPVGAASNLASHTVNPSASGTKTSGRYIAVGQAFYVVGIGSGDQDVVFKNSQRIFVEEDGGTSSVFMKPSKRGGNSKPLNKQVVSEDTRTKFRIGFNTPNGGHRQLLLGFDERASNAIDYGFDGMIKELNSDDFYWEIESQKFVIQGTNSYSLDSEFPLGITLKEAGLISIEVDAFENIEDGTKLYIKDNLTGETYDISTSPVEFNLEAGEFSNRFFLVFQPRLFGIDEVSLNEGLIAYMDNTRSEIKIKKIVETDIKSIHLFNYLGQNVSSWLTNLEERIITLPVNKTTGMYIVQINTKDGVINKKVIIE